MWRCIIFGSSFPEYLVGGRRAAPYISEDSSPEKAMMANLETVLNQEVPDWLRTHTTWQPSTGVVFVNGIPCGVVFETKR
jgi:hypothetical protein